MLKLGILSNKVTIYCFFVNFFFLFSFILSSIIIYNVYTIFIFVYGKSDNFFLIQFSV